MSPHTLEASVAVSNDHAAARWAPSEPDRATAFEPLPPAPAEGTARPTSVLDSDWSGNGTVLVVDDDEAVGAVAAAMLEHLGFDVVRANDGRQALTAYSARGGDFAFLLLDLTMPTGGEDVLAELERMGALTPIVLFSGYSVEELRRRMSGRGVTAFLQKPFELCDLLAAAHHAVASSSSRKPSR
jgi:two-component system, cell cycle sensor histidine kinase and response regulator CckA